MFVVVAVGCGGRVHFYMIHILRTSQFHQDLLDPLEEIKERRRRLKVGNKKFMILPSTFL